MIEYSGHLPLEILGAIPTLELLLVQRFMPKAYPLLVESQTLHEKRALVKEKCSTPLLSASIF